MRKEDKLRQRHSLRIFHNEDDKGASTTVKTPKGSSSVRKKRSPSINERNNRLHLLKS